MALGGSEATVWRLDTVQIRSVLENADANLLTAAFVDGGHGIVTSSSDHAVQVWDAELGGARFALRKYESKLAAIAASRDGKWIAAAGDDLPVELWSAADGRRADVRTAGSKATVALAFVDGTRLAIADTDGAVRLLDLGTQNVPSAVAVDLPDIIAIRVSEDRKRLLLFDSTNLPSVYDIERRTTIWRRPATTDIAATPEQSAISPNGRYVIDGSRLYDVDNNALVANLILDKKSGFRGTPCFSSDSTRLAIGSYDGTIVIWDSATGNSIRILRGHQESITAITFSRGDAQLISAATDGTVRMWRELKDDRH